MMRRALTAVVALGLTACVTVEPDGVPRSKADPVEAARINTQLGIDYLRQGELERARDKLERAVDQDGSQPLAHTSLAFAYQQLGQFEKADRHYRRAVSLSPRDPDILNNYGVFLCSQGRGDEALKRFEQALENPANRRTEVGLTNAGVCARKQGNNAAAEAYFRRALRANPEFPDALAQMALLAHDRGEYLTARAFVQRYDSVSRMTPDVLWIAVRTERALGDRAAADNYADQLKRQFPRADETYQLLRLENNG